MMIVKICLDDKETKQPHYTGDIVNIYGVSNDTCETEYVI